MQNTKIIYSCLSLVGVKGTILVEKWRKEGRVITATLPLKVDWQSKTKNENDKEKLLNLRQDWKTEGYVKKTKENNKQPKRILFFMSQLWVIYFPQNWNHSSP